MESIRALLPMTPVAHSLPFATRVRMPHKAILPEREEPVTTP
jgi:hypothetical protein